MDLGCPVAAGVQEPPAKKTAAVKSSKQEEEEKQMKTLLVVIAKLCMSNAMTARVLKGILIICYRMPVNHWMIENSMRATKKYAETMKAFRAEGPLSEDKKEQMGTPNVHGFNAVLAAAPTALREAAPEFVKVLEKSIVEWGKLDCKPVKLIQHSVPHFKVSRMFQGDWKRLEFHTKETPLLPMPSGVIAPHEALLEIMKIVSVDKSVRQLEGVAPPGDLERKIQKFLDENEPK